MQHSCLNQNTRRISLIVLGIIIVAGTALRLLRVNYLLPYTTAPIDPDENSIISCAIRIMRTGDFNPHFFNYPSLLIYLQTMVSILYYFYGMGCGHLSSIDDIYVTKTHPAIISPPEILVWSRILIILLSSTSIVFTFILARQIHRNTGLALMASAITAFAPIYVYYSTFGIVDPLLSFMILLTILLSIKCIHEKNIKLFIAIGFLLGFCIGSKYTGFLVVVSVLAAYYFSPYKNDLYVLAAISACASIGFLLTTPYALLDLHTFLRHAGFEVKHYAIYGNGFLTANSFSQGIKMYWAMLIDPVQGVGHIAWLSLPGILIGYLLAENRKGYFVLAAFPVAYFIFMSTQKAIKLHALVPLVPFIAIFIAAFLSGAIIFLKQLGKHGINNHKIDIAIIVMGSFFMILWGDSLKHAINKTLADRKYQDSRYIAAQWINDNLPAGSRIAVAEQLYFYLPSIDRNKFYVTGVDQLKHTASWYQSHGFDYVVTSDRFDYWERVATDPFFEYITDDIREEAARKMIILNNVFREYRPIAAFGHETFYIDTSLPTRRVVIYNIRKKTSSAIGHETP